MMEPLRILHVFSTFGPGGPQVRACQLMNALGPRFSHTVIATDGHSEAASRIAPGVACRLLPRPPGKGGLLYALEFRQLLRALRPHLLVTYNWGAFDALVAGVVSSVCPVLHAEDGFGSDEADRLKRRRVLARRAFVNRLYGVVVPSRTLQNIAVLRYKAHPQNVHLIPNGVDVSLFRPGREPSLRDAWGIPRDTLLFGYTGRLSDEKNLGLLIRAFAAARPPRSALVLVGQGPCRAGLEELARSLGIADRVVFAGFVESMPRCYRALDVFVMSSLTEQMPVSLLEAMAAGLPAICTDVGDCAEVLGTADPRVVVPSADLPAYAAAIAALSAGDGLRQNLGARNRACAVAHFSQERMVAAYARLYLSAAGLPGGRPMTEPAAPCGESVCS